MSTGGFLTLVGLSETLKQHYLSKKFERAERTPLRGFPVCRYVVPFFERLSVAAGQLLTIIPRARMGYESIAHEAEGRMGY